MQMAKRIDKLEKGERRAARAALARIFETLERDAKR
jgi:hypothetical protein